MAQFEGAGEGGADGLVLPLVKELAAGVEVGDGLRPVVGLVVRQGGIGGADEHGDGADETAGHGGPLWDDTSEWILPSRSPPGKQVARGSIPARRPLAARIGAALQGAVRPHADAVRPAPRL